MFSHTGFNNAMKGKIYISAFFLIAGIGLIVFAFKIAKHVTEEEKTLLEEKKKEEQDSE